MRRLILSLMTLAVLCQAVSGCAALRRGADDPRGKEGEVLTPGEAAQRGAAVGGAVGGPEGAAIGAVVAALAAAVLRSIERKKLKRRHEDELAKVSGKHPTKDH